MKKFIFCFLFFILFSFISVHEAKAALITVNTDGRIVWQVLGDSTNLTIPSKNEIQIKNIADNINTGNNQIALNNTDGKITLNGMDVTSLKENLVEVLARQNSNDIKIASTDNKFTIEENNIKAETNFPITIDPDKNELSVTTNSGSRLISVLPYEAAVSVMRAKIINSIKNNLINLDESVNGELQYSISGTRNVNLFNVANINADVVTTVSASNGEIVKVDEPQWLKIFGFLFT